MFTASRFSSRIGLQFHMSTGVIKRKDWHTCPKLLWSIKVFKLISLFKWMKWSGIIMCEAESRGDEEEQVKGEEGLLSVSPGDTHTHKRVGVESINTSHLCIVHFFSYCSFHFTCDHDDYSWKDKNGKKSPAGRNHRLYSLVRRVVKSSAEIWHAGQVFVRFFTDTCVYTPSLIVRFSVISDVSALICYYESLCQPWYHIFF